MRLRRETGDFQIVVNTSAGTVNAIRAGLSAEDLAGELIKVDGVYEPVLSAGDNEGTTVIETKSYTLIYTKATGAITTEANSSGEGGDDSGGSTSIVVECTMEYNSDSELFYFGFDGPITAGLSLSDIMEKLIFLVTDAEASIMPQTFCVRPASVQDKWYGNDERAAALENVFYIGVYGSYSSLPAYATSIPEVALYYNSSNGKISHLVDQVLDD